MYWFSRRRQECQNLLKFSYFRLIKGCMPENNLYNRSRLRKLFSNVNSHTDDIQCVKQILAKVYLYVCHNMIMRIMVWLRNREGLGIAHTLVIMFRQRKKSLSCMCVVWGLHLLYCYKALIRSAIALFIRQKIFVFWCLWTTEYIDNTSWQMMW